MKLIFIDIDGVMNSAMGKEPYMADMEVSKLKLLKSIIDDNGVFGIVLTSDRRYSKVYMKYFIDALDQFEIFMVDMTRWPKSIEEDIEDNRGKQIRDYLVNNKADKFVILDDMDDGISDYFPNEFIKVNRFFGLNEEICNRVKEILNK